MDRAVKGLGTKKNNTNADYKSNTQIICSSSRRFILLRWQNVFDSFAALCE